MAERPKFRRLAMLLEIEHRIDPDETLDPLERRKQAETLLHEQYVAMGRRSGESRRQRAALLKDLSLRREAEAVAVP